MRRDRDRYERDEDDDRRGRGRGREDDDDRRRSDDRSRGSSESSSSSESVFPPRPAMGRRQSSHLSLDKGQAVTARSVGQFPWYPFFAHAVPVELIPDSPLAVPGRKNEILIPCFGSPPPDQWANFVDDKGLLVPMPEGVKKCEDFLLPNGIPLHKAGELDARIVAILFVHTLEEGNYVEEIQDLRIGRWRSGSLDKGMIGQLEGVKNLMEDLDIKRFELMLMTISRSSEGFGSYGIRGRAGDRNAERRLRRDHPEWLLTGDHLDHIDEQLPRLWEWANPYLSTEECEVLCGMRERERSDGGDRDRRRPVGRTSGSGRALPPSARKRDDDDDEDDEEEEDRPRSGRSRARDEDEDEDDERPARKPRPRDDDDDEEPAPRKGSARRLDDEDDAPVDPKDYDKAYGPLADDVRRRDKDEARKTSSRGASDLEDVDDADDEDEPPRRRR